MASRQREGGGYLVAAEVADTAPRSGYPYDLPAVRRLDAIEWAQVTILVGENGSGKSTIVEALAVAAGFNAEGGGKNLQFTTHATHSPLHEHLTLGWKVKPSWGWFLRAETFYGMASHIANDAGRWGIRKMFPDFHAESHGESFVDLFLSRLGGDGFYLLDEPEAALSFEGQLKLLRVIHDACEDGAQFVIATHSPLLMAFPGARLYQLDSHGVQGLPYDEVLAVRLWRRFLAEPESVLEQLLDDEPAP